MLALFYLVSFVDGILEIRYGETTWNFLQTFRIVVSFIFAFLHAYISCLTEKFDDMFKLGLDKAGRFWFLLFVLIMIFLLLLLTFPTS
jgi:hypothetical protein